MLQIDTADFHRLYPHNSVAGFKHIFWSIIVCVAMGCAAIFLYSNTIDFMNATVVTTVDTMTVPLSEVFFPSVVVCNINQVGALPLMLCNCGT